MDALKEYVHAIVPTEDNDVIYGSYTVEDIYNSPEDDRIELIYGKLYNMGAPSAKHQFILGHCYRKIADHIDENNGDCRPVMAPFAVKLFDDEKTLVEPDISVICDPDKIDDKGCNGAPDWIIEIVSPGNPGHDFVMKFHLYRKAGVREYWIIDPRNETVFVYYFEKNLMQNYTFDTPVYSNIYSGLAIELSQFKERLNI